MPKVNVASNGPTRPESSVLSIYFEMKTNVASNGSTRPESSVLNIYLQMKFYTKNAPFIMSFMELHVFASNAD